jgi:thiol-disulfide isomerase/thioredoxin
MGRATSDLEIATLTPMQLHGRRLVLAAFVIAAISACKRSGEQGNSGERGTTTSTSAKFTSITLKPSQGDLTTLLAAEAKKAKAQSKKPFVEIGADWCGPCKELEASMTDARMIDAFEGTYQIKLDQDAWEKQLKAAKLDSSAIPVFFELAEDGTPTGRKIDGGAWAENIPVNMAPPLKKFFRGG